MDDQWYKFLYPFGFPDHPCAQVHGCGSRNQEARFEVCPVCQGPIGPDSKPAADFFHAGQYMGTMHFGCHRLFHRDLHLEEILDRAESLVFLAPEPLNKIPPRKPIN